jgi:hypothetical protein
MIRRDPPVETSLRGGQRPTKQSPRGIWRCRGNLLLVSLIILTLACSTLTPTRTSEPPSARPEPGEGNIDQPASPHYEDQWLSIDYPMGWNRHLAGDPNFEWHPPVGLEGELIVALGNPASRHEKTYSQFVRIIRRTVCTCTSLAKVMEESYAALNTVYPMAESPYKGTNEVKVSGIASPQKIYRFFWGEPAFDLRDIWVRQGENVFIISTSTRWSNSDDLAAWQSTVDEILGSVVIK